MRDQRVLLVLDNFEHLLPAATLVAELVRECPQVALLVTSRTALRLRVERRVLVRPLDTPTADCPSPDAVAASPAVRLFVERARELRRTLRWIPVMRPSWAQSLLRLDGLPLAIELAAARSVLLAPPPCCAAWSDASPCWPVSSDLPARQQALRHTMAWSLGLLGDAEQRLFRRLAVFGGGWTLTAAESVCADGDLSAAEVIDRLQVLVDSSLVQRLGDPGSEDRFGMLETVREYAQELLEGGDEAQATRARHAAYFVALAEQAEPELRRADPRVWLDRLEHDLGNLREVLAWAHSSGEFELGLRLGVALVSSARIAAMSPRDAPGWKR